MHIEKLVIENFKVDAHGQKEFQGFKKNNDYICVGFIQKNHLILSFGYCHKWQPNPFLLCFTFVFTTYQIGVSLSTLQLRFNIVLRIVPLLHKTT